MESLLLFAFLIDSCCTRNSEAVCLVLVVLLRLAFLELFCFEMCLLLIFVSCPLDSEPSKPTIEPFAATVSRQGKRPTNEADKDKVQEEQVQVLERNLRSCNRKCDFESSSSWFFLLVCCSLHGDQERVLRVLRKCRHWFVCCFRGAKHFSFSDSSENRCLHIFKYRALLLANQLKWLVWESAGFSILRVCCGIEIASFSLAVDSDLACLLLFACRQSLCFCFSGGRIENASVLQFFFMLPCACLLLVACWPESCFAMVVELKSKSLSVVLHNCWCSFVACKTRGYFQFCAVLRFPIPSSNSINAMRRWSAFTFLIN